VHGPDVEFDGASFDSRSTRPGQLFVPIVAERDGHDFIAAAYAGGAAAHLTSVSEPAAHGGTAIHVADTSAALLDLAAHARRTVEAQCVGITGSVGKTSTKDLVAAAIATSRRTVANVRSFNNEQGLPVTILDAPDDTEVFVLEMGMRGFGQITRLCDVARPTVGVVTAVGHAHTELVGGIEGVAKAKGELVEALPADGTAVLNADDHRVVAMAARTEAHVVTYGAAGDVRAVDLELDVHARARFTVESPWGRSQIRLPLSGVHMAANALAAIAVGGVLGVPLDAIAEGLATAELSAMRMELVDVPGGGIVINDAYNANPTSMRAALDSLAAMTAQRRVAVLGAMGELDDPAVGHREVAEHARQLGVELVAVGTDLYGIAPVDDPVAALGALGDGDVVLVKASRAAGLERVVEALRDGGR
jgi:UDP-N-acetylmuramoyl-tripeptide--D-alanyl-D-alanine ligase